MTELEDLEQRFWSMVWQCHHRHPCKKCCWPYDHCLRDQYRTTAPRIYQPPIPVHRLAYILAHGALLLPARAGTFAICHRCDFKPCCNPTHLFVGTQGDNSRDASLKGYFAFQRYHPVRLPDGTLFHRRPTTMPTQLRPDWRSYLRSLRTDQWPEHTQEVETSTDYLLGLTDRDAPAEGGSRC
jgi:hypothetical protein